MPVSGTPDDQGSQQNGERGTQTDPTVKDNLTFTYLEVCCEGECPQKTCSDPEVPADPATNTCPVGPVTSLSRPCGESPPCAAATDKCMAYVQTEAGEEQPPPSPRAVLSPRAVPSVQSAPVASARGPSETEIVCNKGICPGFKTEPAPSLSPRPLSPTPSAQRGVSPIANVGAAPAPRPESKDGCPTFPCPSNDPDSPYICRPTPCPGAGPPATPTPSQGGLSGRGADAGASERQKDCKKQQCPAVQAALEAAYGPAPPPAPASASPCQATVPVCEVTRPGLSPQRSCVSRGPVGSGYPSAMQMGPCGGAPDLRPQLSPTSAHMGPAGQISPSRGPSAAPLTCAGSQQRVQSPSSRMGGMAPQGGVGSKCPADQGLWPQYRRPQPTIKCTGMDTCPRQNPAILGPLSPLAQMYLDMSKPKHDWGDDPFKDPDATRSAGTRGPSRDKGEECCGRAASDRNRITLCFAKNLHPVIDVSLSHVECTYDEADDGGGGRGGNNDSCCGKQRCCKMCK